MHGPRPPQVVLDHPLHKVPSQPQEALRKVTSTTHSMGKQSGVGLGIQPFSFPEAPERLTVGAFQPGPPADNGPQSKSAGR